MRTTKIRDLMVPLEEYAVVHEDTNLHDAIIALEESQPVSEMCKDKHRAILVVDDHKQVIGKASMYSILIALEPRYKHVRKPEMVSRHGYNLEFLHSVFKDNMLWDNPMEYIVSRSVNIRIGDIMDVPEEGVYIDEDASLGEALHQMLVPREMSLLVTRDSAVVGILRITDVFAHVCGLVKSI